MGKDGILVEYVSIGSACAVCGPLYPEPPPPYSEPRPAPYNPDFAPAFASNVSYSWPQPNGRLRSVSECPPQACTSASQERHRLNRSQSVPCPNCGGELYPESPQDPCVNSKGRSKSRKAIERTVMVSWLVLWPVYCVYELVRQSPVDEEDIKGDIIVAGWYHLFKKRKNGKRPSSQ